MKSTGGWMAFGHEDKPLVPGQESGKIFTKEGLLTFAVIMAVIIVGGMVYSCFFGPHL